MKPFNIYLLLIIWLNIDLSCLPAATDSHSSSQLKETFLNYLAVDSGYQPGDLLTRSQLQEFQTFYRRTKGNSLVSHLRWRQRLLPDTAPLVKIFYSEGKKVLREAAKQLGSYHYLDRFSRSGEGRKLIQKAINQESAEILIKAAQAEQQETKKIQSDQQTKPARKERKPRIFTAAEFLSELEQAMSLNSESAGNKEIKAPKEAEIP